jgi:hypothetical protein
VGQVSHAFEVKFTADRKGKHEKEFIQGRVMDYLGLSDESCDCCGRSRVAETRRNSFASTPIIFLVLVPFSCVVLLVAASENADGDYHWVMVFGNEKTDDNP